MPDPSAPHAPSPTVAPGTRVCITGANGFVGSNLCGHLLASGCDVHGLVRPGSDRRFVSTLLHQLCEQRDLSAKTGKDSEARRTGCRGCGLLIIPCCVLMEIVVVERRSAVPGSCGNQAA